MSFGKSFGELVKRKRAAEGLTQQALAVKAFGDESYKTRISEIENAKITKPHAKTVDALIVALNISQQEFDAILNESPHPRIVDTFVDFVDYDPAQGLDIDIAVNADGKAVIFHDRPLRVEIVRVEYFVEERMLVFLEKEGRRRPVGLPVTEEMDELFVNASKVLLVYIHPTTHEPLEGLWFPIKVIS